MAGASLLTLLDDIATVLDDVALMTRTAAKKTAGVLGDDLALNAQQVAGLQAARELPVVFAVAKGSFINKLILVPLALLISALAPWAITPLLMLGGIYLCYEGAEKILHPLLHRQNAAAHSAQETLAVLSAQDIDLVELEKDKIKGAIRTDFILSAEIIVIALGTLKEASLGLQVAALSAVAIFMTVGVYTLVAAIVKLDDVGLHLLERPSNARFWGTIKRRIGSGLLNSAPYLMKTLAVAGTIAMFMVGGGILLHGIPAAHTVIHPVTEAFSALGATGTFVAEAIINALAGVAAGAVALLLASAISKLRKNG